MCICARLQKMTDKAPGRGTRIELNEDDVDPYSKSASAGRGRNHAAHG